MFIIDSIYAWSMICNADVLGVECWVLLCIIWCWCEDWVVNEYSLGYDCGCNVLVYWNSVLSLGAVGYG